MVSITGKGVSIAGISILSEKRIHRSQYHLTDSTSNILVYKSKTSKALGFVFREFKTYQDIATMTNTEVDSLALSNIFIHPNDEEIIEKYAKCTSVNSNPLETSNNLFAIQTQSDSLMLTHFEPSRIKGTIQLNESGILFLSILYDKGWRLLLNGEKSSFYQVHGGFIGIPLTEGEHQIELSFKPPLFNLGLAVSLVSILIVVVVSVFGFWKRKTLQ